MSRTRDLPPNVTSFLDRHRKLRFRYRKAGQTTVYLREDPGTARRPSAEVRALAARQTVRIDRAKPGTVDDLCARFYRSVWWQSAGERTRHVRRLILERFRARHGAKRVRMISFEHVEAILVVAARKSVDERGREVGGKEAARSLGRLLARMFDLAERLGMVERNPVRLAEAVKGDRTVGFHPWTDEEIARYQAHWPLGSKGRLALEIILWTWQRRGDARLFGRGHLKGGLINYRQAKTGKDLWLPAAPQLIEAIAAMPVTGHDVFLVTDFGKPFTAAGFGNKMRQWCDAAGLPHCSAHGLRKAGARRAAEAGATQQGLKAVGGWSNDREVATYTAAADQRRLAEAALGHSSAADLANRREKLANQSGQVPED